MKKEIFVAAALIFENGKLFATRRGDCKYSYVAHKYEFPGGKIENGERAEDCVKRELKEELDMDVEVGELFAVVAVHTFLSQEPHIALLVFFYGNHSFAAEAVLGVQIPIKLCGSRKCPQKQDDYN